MNRYSRTCRILIFTTTYNYYCRLETLFLNPVSKLFPAFSRSCFRTRSTSVRRIPNTAQWCNYPGFDCVRGRVSVTYLTLHHQNRRIANHRPQTQDCNCYCKSESKASSGGGLLRIENYHSYNSSIPSTPRNSSVSFIGSSSRGIDGRHSHCISSRSSSSGFCRHHTLSPRKKSSSSSLQNLTTASSRSISSTSSPLSLCLSPTSSSSSSLQNLPPASSRSLSSTLSPSPSSLCLSPTSWRHHHHHHHLFVPIIACCSCSHSHRRSRSAHRRGLHTSPTMAKSKFEYVRQFETDDPCLPNCWLVVRIDGKAFHKFTDNHHYMKPNDDRGLGLMTRAAQNVMAEFNEVVLAYGQSDEYSFVFHKNCKLYNRRASKIMTNVVSLFSSSFTLYWNRFFNTQELQYPPSFDARVVLYPSDDNIKDYLSWRQADCHINNLYNTCFWKLVQEKGLSPAGAQETLKGTLSSDKNEILFSEFNCNYNSLPELYRKGTVIIRPTRDVEFANDIAGQVNNSTGYSGGSHKSKGKSQKPASVILHCDIIGKQFWEEHPYVLASKKPV